MESALSAPVSPTAQPGPYSFELIDPAKHEHLQSSADIMRLIWGDNDFSSLDYVRWQYVQNPAGPVIGYFAWPEQKPSDNIPAAQYVVIPSTLWIPSIAQDLKSALSVNTATHSGHQKKGLFVKSADKAFARAAEIGIQNVYGFPNDNSLPGFIKLGFAQLPQLQFFFGVSSYLGSASKLFTVLRNWNFPQLRELRAATPSQGATYIPEHEILKQFAHCPRTTKWVNWRYASHPTRRYTIINDSISGFVFCLKELHGLRIALLMDVLGNPSAASIANARSFLRSERAHVVAGVFTQNQFEVFPETRSLLPFRVPLKYSPKPFHLILKDLTSKGLPRDSFHCSLGDIDLY